MNQNLLPSHFLAMVLVAAMSQIAFVCSREEYPWARMGVVALQFLVTAPFLVNDLFLHRGAVWKKTVNTAIFLSLFSPSLLYELLRVDRVLFTVMYNSGARVSELTGLCRGDVDAVAVTSIRIHGKGRKERTVPLWKRTANLVSDWLTEIAPSVSTPLFPNRHGRPLSRSGVEDRLQQAVAKAQEKCSSLRKKNVSPHTLRHTPAMHLLQAGVDVTLIALWLGHESLETTHQYVEADLEMKRRVLDRPDEPMIPKGKKKKKADLLEFLDGL